MRRKLLPWAMLAFIGVILLYLYVPVLPKAKAHAQRIQSVNNVARVTITLPNNHAAPFTAPDTKY
jgi:hypothetical protein